MKIACGNAKVFTTINELKTSSCLMVILGLENVFDKVYFLAVAYKSNPIKDGHFVFNNCALGVFEKGGS